MINQISLKTWFLYFIEDEFTVFNEKILMINNILNYISNFTIKKIPIQYISYKFYMMFPDIQCISCAISEFLYIKYNEFIKIETRIGISQYNGIIINSFSQLLPNLIGKIVLIKGIICHVGYKKLENISGFFECTKCNTIIQHRLIDNIYIPPKICQCKSKTFIFLNDHPNSIIYDKQELKIQELYTTEKPKIIDVVVYNKNIGMYSPGDIIEAIGIVKAKLKDNNYQIKLELNNIIKIQEKNISEEYTFNNKQQLIVNKLEPLIDIEGEDTSFLSTNLSSNDFIEFSNQSNILGILINNIYPDIYGNEVIKMGLILSMIGGTRKIINDEEKRSEIHILMVGDPGLGKSKFLLNTVKVLPKSIYVSGNFTTTVGLTVSVTHDSISGEFVIDAGALVLSDKGICCIDEFDKITEHASLFETMENQMITIAKGGVLCSIPVKPTIIAASNPKDGKFVKTKSIKDNLKFNSILLSRFDLIFILTDNLTFKENCEISNYIFKKKYKISTNNSLSKSENLIQKIQNKTKFYEETTVKISLDFIKQYIDYVKKNCEPILSLDAQRIFKEFYLKIRKTNKNITIRNFESLIRLGEAYSKLHLRSIVTQQDAETIIQFYNLILDNFKNIDSNISSNKTNDLESKIKEFIIKNNTTDISKSELINLIKQTSYTKNPIDIIETLNYKGIIIKKLKDQYKINLK